MAAVTPTDAPVLHAIYDPLCGWCYAAAPLLAAAREVPGLALQLHAGGMMVGAQRRAMGPAWRDHVMPHDQRIALLSGQPFGAAYFDGLLADAGAVLDSEPPTTAILAAQALGGQGLALLHRLQRAHYVEGRRIAERAVLREAAQDIGLDGAAFDAACDAQAGAPTQAHIAQSRALLARLGGQGFPTLALQRGSQWQLLPTGQFLGQPQAFAAFLRG